MAVETLLEFAGRFDTEFHTSLAKEIDKISEYSRDESVLQTYGHLLTLAKSGGKRARPYVASLLYRACSDRSDEDIMQFLIALETFHLFALVHDDVMDNAEVRHGLPTVHAAVRTRLAQSSATGDTRNTAQAEAILTGDFLLTLVHQFVLHQHHGVVPRQRVDEAHRLLIQMSREVVIGQHLDIEFTTRRDVQESDILARHHLKTSLYTFVRPMQIGALLAGADVGMLDFCQAFGSALGMGFQLEDDLLDLLADESALGKVPGADLTQRQHTLLTAKLRQRGTSEQSAMLESFWGHALTGLQRENARQIFKDSGAIDAVRARATQAFADAHELLNASPLPKPATHALEQLLLFFQARLP